jgi:hypothetical protein
MEAWAKEFITVWEQNREQLAKLGLHHIQNNPLIPIKEYALDDALQLLDGTTAMMREVLEGTGTDVRDMYFNSVVPGVLAQGNPPQAFVAQVTLVAVLYTAMVLPQIRETYRSQAAEFLGTFFMTFNYEIVKAAMEMGARA